MPQKKKSKSVHVREDECDDPVPKDFVWSTPKKIALLHGMIKLKPAGTHKHLNMLLIKENIKNSMKKTVPTSAIWKYIHSYWNTVNADNIEIERLKLGTKDFDLSKDKKWIHLIQEQKEKLDLNDTNKGAVDQAVISDVDSKALKSVKVMVEKLDSYGLLVDCLKFNKISNWEKTLKNELNCFQTECTPLKEFTEVNSNRSSRSKCFVKKKLAISQFKIQDLKGSKELKLNNVIMSEPELSSRKKTYKLRARTTSSARASLRSKTPDFNVPGDIMLKNVMLSEPALSLKRKSYKLRSRYRDPVLDKLSRSLQSKIKSSAYASNLNSKKSIIPIIK